MLENTVEFVLFFSTVAMVAPTFVLQNKTPTAYVYGTLWLKILDTHFYSFFILVVTVAKKEE